VPLSAWRSSDLVDLKANIQPTSRDIVTWMGGTSCSATCDTRVYRPAQAADTSLVTPTSRRNGGRFIALSGYRDYAKAYSPLVVRQTVESIGLWCVDTFFGEVARLMASGKPIVVLRADLKERMGSWRLTLMCRRYHRPIAMLSAWWHLRSEPAKVLAEYQPAAG
jgi:hypothetical protein